MGVSLIVDQGFKRKEGHCGNWALSKKTRAVTKLIRAGLTEMTSKSGRLGSLYNLLYHAHLARWIPTSQSFRTVVPVHCCSHSGPLMVRLKRAETSGTVCFLSELDADMCEATKTAVTVILPCPRHLSPEEK